MAFDSRPGALQPGNFQPGSSGLVADPAPILPVLTGSGTLYPPVIGDSIRAPALTGAGSFFGLTVGLYMTLPNLAGSSTFLDHEILKAGARLPVLTGSDLLLTPDSIFDPATSLVVPRINGISFLGKHRVRNTSLQLPLLTGAGSLE